MEDYSDKKLMKLVVERNSQAFKILYQRYELQIFNFILNYTGRRELAQDLLQETFTRVWFAAHTFNLKKGNFREWVYTIALNITRNEMSKKQYDYQYVDVSEIFGGNHEPIHPETEQPDVKLNQSELKDTILRLLGQLNPHLREIIILKHYQQLKFREIAQITKMPEGTLKARFHRAIAQLKVLLEPLEL
ncbi:MAG: RNA polymerase sigma factor [bacterium]|nr:MAG: RNA polymerase sigma factor [bacterium]